MINKSDALAKKLGEGVCAVILSPENRFYFTGFSSSSGALLVSRNEAVFLTDSRYIEAAKGKIRACSVEEMTSLSEQLSVHIRRMNCTQALVEADRITLSEFARLKKALKGVKFISDGTLDLMINEQRAVKDGDEVQKIKKAQSIAEQAFEYILSVIKEGMSERELALKLDFKMLELGAQAISFETILVSGKKTSMPHGVPGDKKIESGDFVTLDFGAVFEGYHSDMTRTVAIGKVSDEHIRVYDTVLKAQENALKNIRAGVTGEEADAFARSVIEKAGYGEYFRHSTGHGTGVEIHEAPALSKNNKKPLLSGNIITVEPGIYIPGKFGVRIEDMCVVTDGGVVNLTAAPKELITTHN